MAYLEVAGRAPLCGRVCPSGAKNAVLKLMAAALLTDQPCRLHGVPVIGDVLAMVELLRAVGADVRWTGPHDLEVRGAGPLQSELPDGLVASMRASVQLIGPLVARLGRVRLGQPGGCDIGERPIDLHLKGLAAMGASVREEGGRLEVEARALHGAEVVLDFPSVGATENLMCAAALACGRTCIHNAAREPEVEELQNFLRAMGARVWGSGTPTICVEGVAQLTGARWELMPDRIETATWMIGAALTGGCVTVEGARPEHVAAVTAALREAGAAVEASGGALEVRAAPDRPAAVSVTARPYPGFPTDAQPLWVAFMGLAGGTALVREEVHSRRFGYVAELWRMGADITVEGTVAVVRGVSRLTGADVTARDLRGGAALLLAALAAQGESRIRELQHLDRGYEALETKLASLGARVRRVEKPQPVVQPAAPLGLAAGGRVGRGR